MKHSQRGRLTSNLCTDATGCSVSSSSVTVGSGTGNSSNIITNVSGNTTDGFTVTMEYVIANGDNGAISFGINLTDGTNTTNLTTSPQTYTVTADTTAPTYSSSTAVPSAGTSFSITFSEDISVDTANGGNVATGFELKVAGSTVTGYTVAIDSTNADTINFSSIPTIYSSESVSLNYTQPQVGIHRLRDNAGIWVDSFTSSDQYLIIQLKHHLTILLLH